MKIIMEEVNMNKKIMTLDEHWELGKKLQDIRNALVTECVELDGIYGKTKEYGLTLERAVKWIDSVRSKLDDRLFNEYPELETKEGCKYYYRN
jgi:hypothetical protein